MAKESGKFDINKSLAALLRESKKKGMDDSVPAIIDGEQPAALSEGEFIVPADVVSMIGDGNTEAGAEILQKLIDSVRKSKQGGSARQAPPLMKGLEKMFGYGGQVKK